MTTKNPPSEYFYSPKIVVGGARDVSTSFIMDEKK